MKHEALCHSEPRGRNGLEGFMRDCIYQAELHQSRSGNCYWKMYLTDTYYETIGPINFNKYFKLVEELPFPLKSLNNSMTEAEMRLQTILVSECPEIPEWEEG